METLSYYQLMERMLAAEARVVELESGKVGNALLERENHHVEVVGKLTERIAELESRSVKLPKAMSIEGGAYCSAHAHYDSDGDYYDRADVEEMLTTAGIKWVDK